MPWRLCGKLFALSATGARQADLERLILRNGGRISRTVHQRVDFLVATRLALEKNTQSVRKVRGKFGGTMDMVLPEFVHESIQSGNLVDPEQYSPETPPPAGEASAAAGASSLEDLLRKPLPASKRSTLAEVGLEDGGRIDVLVEMSDAPPFLVWWPSRVQEPTSSAAAAHHDLVYGPLPERGYDAESPSRARFSKAASHLTGQPDGAVGHLYDLLEATWRPWRHSASASLTVAAAEREAACKADVSDGVRTRSSSTHRSRRHPLRAFPFKRLSAGRAFRESARRAAARARIFKQKREVFKWMWKQYGYRCAPWIQGFGKR